MPARPTLFLIDGNNQMYRAYHAIRGLTGPDGRSTNAVYGFVTMLRKLLADHAPTHVAASFDTAGPTFRDAIVDDYKANRAPMPPDLVEQVAWVHQACAAMGVPVVNHEGVEADDVIGTLAKKAADAGYDVAIVTGDKDFFQLVGGPIRVFNPRDEGTWFDAAGVVEKCGVPPERVIDMLSLTGDTVDNVKGVPGIGEKGARDLINEFGSLDSLLEGAGRVAQKRYREALLTHADDARRSRELVTIKTDVPVDTDFQAFAYTGPHREQCHDLFGSLGFRSLTNDYAPTAATVTTDYAIVESMDELDAVLRDVRASGRLALFPVADAPSPMQARLVGLAIATASRRARYLPLGHQTLDATANLPGRDVVDRLAPVLADPAVELACHDVKFAAMVCTRYDMPPGGPVFDPMLASYLIDATRAPHAIEDLAMTYLGYKAAGPEDMLGKGAKAVSAADIPASAVLDFACERADLAWQLTGTLRAMLDEQGLAELYRDMELPLVPVLMAIEQAGVRVDTGALGTLSARLEREMGLLTSRIHELAGEVFNINSPKQLGDVLFDKLKLPAGKKTGKTKTASTAVGVLEELAESHELPRLVLDWRAMQKLKGTYVDALPSLVNPRTGRVHTSFNQAVAATGRLSSSDPNLQNIPVRTELGREIRKAFVADPGCVLISADYSQIELRVLAHLAQDAALIDAFNRAEDIHDRTALAIFGADSGRDRKEMRTTAKMVNYALLYGKTAFTLSKDIGVTQQAAQAFIDAYFSGFPGVRTFIDRTLEEARVSGMVKTLFGRKRPVPELTSKNGQVRQAAERVAVNMPIQGTAADILKRAMIDVQRALDARPAAASGVKARMILTVHDELLFEVASEDADEVAALVKQYMEGAAALAVPLTVDVGIGENWNEAKH
ncbi:MAG: DNA polymerase I [Vicinamibacterales bacterium]|nr:DNA polymerase I [Vicinamibacterales bacterium]